MGELWESKRGCLSVQVLQEFYVTVTKKVSRPLDGSEAARTIADLSHWRIHTPGAEDVLEAIDIQSRYKISFGDAMIVRSAVRLGCTVLWSEDLQSGATYNGVRMINPFIAKVKG